MGSRRGHVAGCTVLFLFTSYSHAHLSFPFLEIVSIRDRWSVLVKTWDHFLFVFSSSSSAVSSLSTATGVSPEVEVTHGPRTVIITVPMTVIATTSSVIIIRRVVIPRTGS